MARILRMFLLICCMVVQTLQYENEESAHKTLTVYKSNNEYNGKPAVFTSNTMEEEDGSFKRQKRDSNAPNDKGEIHKNITAKVRNLFRLLFPIFCFSLSK